MKSPFQIASRYNKFKMNESSLCFAIITLFLVKGFQGIKATLNKSLLAEILRNSWQEKRIIIEAKSKKYSRKSSELRARFLFVYS